jgi:hypothetical protein
MGGLNVHADEQGSAGATERKKWFKSPKIIIGVAVLVAVPIVGTTLAATNNGNIQINENNIVSLGQGGAATLPCDDHVVIHPHQIYNDGWAIDYVTIEELNLNLKNSTTGLGCAGSPITLLATDGVPYGVTVSGSSTTFAFDNNGSGTLSINSGYYSGSSWGGGDAPTVVRGGSSATDASTSTVTITYGFPVPSLLEDGTAKIGAFAISEG